jgi:hypothetical protein
MNPVDRRVPAKNHPVTGTSVPYPPARSQGSSRNSPPHDWGESPDACGGLVLSSRPTMVAYNESLCKSRREPADYESSGMPSSHVDRYPQVLSLWALLLLSRPPLSAHIRALGCQFGRHSCCASAGEPPVLSQLFIAVRLSLPGAYSVPTLRLFSTLPYRPRLSCVAGVGVQNGVKPEPSCQTAHVPNAVIAVISPICRRTRMSVESGKLHGGLTIVSGFHPPLFARFHLRTGQLRGPIAGLDCAGIRPHNAESLCAGQEATRPPVPSLPIIHNKKGTPWKARCSNHSSGAA